ncbi:hypothetical protein Nepgr_032079 [Nepenthes gracilis]|uniref:FCP1 homology domain-containing protein n=1 Tax=Nepenthes gracilis TaxID=150966 RepID=A0AAD3TJC0_NEPGR|nr:hypothetical protein Nepgr_032079 [Nepenthes gracilis]
MPSLSMKNSITGCLREKNGLQICKKSNFISKRTCCHVKISQLAAELSTCAHNCEDGPSSDETTARGLGFVAPTDHQKLLSGENNQFNKYPASLVVSAGMELTPVSFTTNFETIFSPTINKLELQNMPDIHDAEGSNTDSGAVFFTAADESDGNRGSSRDYQTCSISDFYVSDMVLASFPFDGSLACDDTAKAKPFAMYDTVEPNVLFDATEQCVSLPFLDDSTDFSYMQIAQQTKRGKMDSDDSSLFLAIHQMNRGDQGSDVDSYDDENRAESFDPHSFIKNLPELSEESQKRKPITLVLDLDETLVHSTLEHCEDADFTFTVFFDMKEHTVYVKQRPYLQTFLERVAEMFELFVFTAGQSFYAEQLLDILDPDGKLISGRAYRESCVFSDGTYTKDLTVLGVDLAKVIIIDNCPQVFRLQVNNGIPIKSWFDDPSDSELLSLIPFLETLVNAEDIRPIIARRFGNKE